ncbi:MAG: mandelate racemase/muconate lactonizing enzyme family protein [Rhodobacteraceae bacterium]|nr:mandelate racemase/muconate lactonizing enzyme family protein [Paracoccaceae bacterium]
MRITGISVWQVPLTSVDTYYMADGKTCDTVDSIIVRLDTDSGSSGWGEVCPIPGYLPAYACGVVPAVRELLPALIGADPVGPEAVMQGLESRLPGHGYVKSALDTALWDLTGKAARLPLYRLIGGRCSRSLPLYHSITCIEPDEMARIAKHAFQSGIRQFQAKLGSDDDWQMDVERLIKVREAVGEGPLVYGDWNCGASRLDAIRVGRAVSARDIMLEQPCKNIESCAAVKTATGLPMKLDESVRNTESLLKAASLGCLDAVAIKLSKFGGLSAARRARDICLHLGVKMCIEDTWGSDIATVAALHLGAATPPSGLLNVCDLSGYVTPRTASDAPSRRNGRIAVPTGPGLGIQPDEGILGHPVARFVQ